MVRAAARLYGDENWRKPLEVADHLGSPKLAPDDHHLILINAVKLEYRLQYPCRYEREYSLDFPLIYL
jgi:hypothetical protein